MSVAEDNSPAPESDGAFAWPPRSATGAAVADSVDLDFPRTSERRQARVASRGPASGSSNAATQMLAFERAFLGLHTPPWRVRAAEAGFVADPDHVYCPRCAGPVGPHEVVGEAGMEACATCRGQRLPWSRAIRLGAWEGVLRESILEAKYARWRRLAFDLGCELGAVLARRMLEAGVDPDAAVVVPVPISFRRRWSRGLDHTLAIARGVRWVSGCSIVRPLWRRHRPPQASLAEGVREANVRGCFAPRNGGALTPDQVVVILDDVRTTGATLRATCRALAARQRRLGEPLELGRVWVATLAVVTPSDRRVEPGLDGAGSGPPEQDSRGAIPPVKF